MKKALGWIILIVIVIVIGYFVQKTKQENREYNEQIMIQEGIKR